MKILYVSEQGDCMGVATAMKLEGHEVQVHIKDKRFDYMGLGIVERPRNWKKEAREADMVIIDMPNPAIVYKDAVKRCKTVVGPTMLCSMLEGNRIRQGELFTKVGLTSPKQTVFDTANLAFDMVEGFPKSGVVVKAADKLSSRSIFPCKSTEEYRFVLERFPADKKIVVQDFVDGQPVTFTKWFNGKGWSQQYISTVYDKSVQYGVAGCGSILSRQTKGGSIVAIFNRLTKFLSAASYSGFVHLQCIVVEDILLVIDIGFGFNSYIMSNIHEWNPSYARMEVWGKVKNRYAMNISLVAPSYPYGYITGEEVGKPIIVKNGDLRGIYLIDVYKSDTMYYQSAAHGVISSVVGTGRTVKASANAAMKVMSRVNAYQASWRESCPGILMNKMQDIVNRGIA